MAYRLLRIALACVLMSLVTIAHADPGDRTPRAPATVEETRLALVVGNNGASTLGRAELRYADDDAVKYALLFGGASREGDVELLTRIDEATMRLFPQQAKHAQGPTRAALSAAALRIAERARTATQKGQRVTFTFVFAGHGDVENGRGFLELEDGRFYREDLEALLLRIPAQRAHVILDACNSVYMLAARKPGGTLFATPEDIERSMQARLAHVGTFLSTSADAQVFEWSELESGVFSHTVRSGLSGAADLDGDGRITYGELRAFVRVAVAGIPNPRFRPRIHARGPGGRDDEVLFEPRAMGESRKLALPAGAERRLTVLDANEVPLVDVRLEQGFGTNVYVPSHAAGLSLVEREPGKEERRVDVKSEGDQLVASADVVPTPTARAARPFQLLFALAFGPRSVAGLPVERSSDEVFGVSTEDREHMQRILDAAADAERDRRRAGGYGGLALGVSAGAGGAGLLAMSIAGDSDSHFLPIFGGILLGLGALEGGLGAYQLLSLSDMEKRRAAYVAALRAKPDAFDLVVRDAEHEILARAERARRARAGARIFALAGSGLTVAGGATLTIVSFASNSHGSGDDVLKVLGITAMASGAPVFVLSLLDLGIRSEDERMADLWRKERGIEAISTPPKLTVKPLIGVGMLGLQGSF